MHDLCGVCGRGQPDRCQNRGKEHFHINFHGVLNPWKPKRDGTRKHRNRTARRHVDATPRHDRDVQEVRTKMTFAINWTLAELPL